MIDFKCAKCGMELQVPDELAGRRAKCPGCDSTIPLPADPRETAGAAEKVAAGAGLIQDEGVLIEALRLLLEGQKEESSRLLTESIMSTEMLAAEKSGLRMIRAGAKPSLAMTDEELGSLLSAYEAMASEAVGNGQTCEEASLGMVAMVYRYAKGALMKRDLLDAVSAWWQPYNQLGLAVGPGCGCSASFDLTPYISTLDQALSEHVTGLLMEEDKRTEGDFSQVSDLKGKREVAKTFCRKVEKAYKELGGEEGGLPCMADLRITAGAWRARWHTCSKAISKDSARVSRKRRG